LLLNLSREYINEFKEFLDSGDESFKFKRYFEMSEITTPIIINTLNKSKIDFAFDTEANVDWDEDESWDVLTIDVTINGEFFPMAFNDFIAEMRDVIRHELEHVAQKSNKHKGFLYKKKKSSDKKKKDRITYAMYILSSTELPAHLQGFLANAKFKKISMTKVIEDFLEGRRNWFFGDEEDYDIVKDKLIESGKKMFPNAKWD